MTSWQRFVEWCSAGDRYPQIFYLTRDNQFARIYDGDLTLDEMIADSEAGYGNG